MREGNLKSSTVLLELSILILSIFCCMEFEILLGTCIFKIGLSSCFFIYLLFLASILYFVSVMPQGLWIFSCVSREYLFSLVSRQCLWLTQTSNPVSCSVDHSYPGTALQSQQGHFSPPCVCAVQGSAETWAEFIHKGPSPVLAVSSPGFPTYSPVGVLAPNSLRWFFMPEKLRIFC